MVGRIKMKINRSQQACNRKNANFTVLFIGIPFLRLQATRWVQV
jgi:hypothetical protein